MDHKQNMLFFGNCNMHCLIEILKTSHLTKYYNFFLFSTHLPKSKEDHEKLFSELIHYSVIVIQPHYADQLYTINNIVSKTNPHCKIIILSVAYFQFYYPTLTYAFSNGCPINIPSAYHDKTLIELYNSKNPNISQKYLQNIYDLDFLTEDYLNDMANNSIAELQKRENNFMNMQYEPQRQYYYITLSTFIKNNYKNKLLFYSMNHPTYHLFEYICNEILILLNYSDMCYTFKKIDPLSAEKCILYSCIQKCVHFNISEHPYCIKNNTTIQPVINSYLNEYKKYETIN